MESCNLDQIKNFNKLYLSLHKNFRDATYAHSKTLGFTVPQVTMIYELFSTPDLTLNELSEKMGLSKSTCSALVERMEKQGVVVREIPKSNRRSVRLSLSQDFISKHEDLLASKDRIISDIFKFETVNSKDAEIINSSLEKLNSLLVASINNLMKTTKNQ